jgi:hypothetical protein
MKKWEERRITIGRAGSGVVHKVSNIRKGYTLCGKVLTGTSSDVSAELVTCKSCNRMTDD